MMTGESLVRMLFEESSASESSTWPRSSNRVDSGMRVDPQARVGGSVIREGDTVTRSVGSATRSDGPWTRRVGLVTRSAGSLDSKRSGRDARRWLRGAKRSLIGAKRWTTETQGVGPGARSVHPVTRRVGPVARSADPLTRRVRPESRMADPVDAMPWVGDANGRHMDANRRNPLAGRGLSTQLDPSGASEPSTRVEFSTMLHAASPQGIAAPRGNDERKVS